MMKTNFSNHSQALAYAVYMMVGSYFKSCRCANSLAEDKYYISYTEAGLKRQYEFETKAEDYVLKSVFAHHKEFANIESFTDTKLTLKLEGEYLLEDVNTSFVRKDNHIDVVFTSKLFKFTISCAYKRGKCIFSYSLAKRRSKQQEGEAGLIAG